MDTYGASHDQLILWIREELDRAMDRLIAGNIDAVTEALKTAHGYTFDLVGDEPDDATV